MTACNANHLTGVIPPVITPLNPDRTLDVPGLERVLERMLAAGVAGIFALGSTGEVAFASPALREQVIGEVVRIVNHRVPVIAGVVDMQTARVIENIRQAQSLGADAVVATAPYYAITLPPEVERHFSILAEHSELPIYAYDIPVCVHTKLLPDMLVRLGARGALAGVKDSSGDDVNFRRLALKNRDAGAGLSLLTGHEFVVDGAYLSGADGCVPGLANVDPAGYVALHQAQLADDWQRVRTEQDRLARLMEICLASRGQQGWAAGVGAFKTALKLLGIIESNQVPQPFEAINAEDTLAIQAILEAHGPTA
ncbi:MULTISPECIES: dihydrodipicolinate synthase family protein [unclassified Luteococcus]|uniref:dihydrodipicolinate synthase family protein n=1 Tax=unclassified Luteococcus TaxID=2639923 RepID=UPI00313B1127